MIKRYKQFLEGQQWGYDKGFDLDKIEELEQCWKIRDKDELKAFIIKSAFNNTTVSVNVFPFQLRYESWQRIGQKYEHNDDIVLGSYTYATGECTFTVEKSFLKEFIEENNIDIVDEPDKTYEIWFGGDRNLMKDFGIVYKEDDANRIKEMLERRYKFVEVKEKRPKYGKDNTISKEKIKDVLND